MKNTTLANKVVSFILVLAMVLSLSMTLTACGGEKEYECAYCGYDMEVPYAYRAGRPACWKCAQIFG